MAKEAPQTIAQQMESMNVIERAALLRQLRSVAEVTYRKALKDGTELVPGKGKGLEPKPWCDCHNRNPCPTITRAEKIING